MYYMKTQRKARVAKELTEKQAKRLEEIRKDTPTNVRVFERSFNGMSKAAALKAKCLDCCGWVRKEVEVCKIEACPLWRFRPYA